MDVGQAALAEQQRQGPGREAGTQDERGAIGEPAQRQFQLLRQDHARNARRADGAHRVRRQALGREQVERDPFEPGHGPAEMRVIDVEPPRRRHDARSALAPMRRRRAAA